MNLNCNAENKWTRGRRRMLENSKIQPCEKQKKTIGLIVKRCFLLSTWRQGLHLAHNTAIIWYYYFCTSP